MCPNTQVSAALHQFVWPYEVDEEEEEEETDEESWETVSQGEATEGGHGEDDDSEMLRVCEAQHEEDGQGDTQPWAPPQAELRALVWGLVHGLKWPGGRVSPQEVRVRLEAHYGRSLLDNRAAVTAAIERAVARGTSLALADAADDESGQEKAPPACLGPAPREYGEEVVIQTACEDWQEVLDENTNRYYFHNKFTNEVTWNKPREVVAAELAATGCFTM